MNAESSPVTVQPHQKWIWCIQQEHDQEASATKEDLDPLKPLCSGSLTHALAILLAQLREEKGSRETVGKGVRIQHVPSPLKQPCP